MSEHGLAICLMALGCFMVGAYGGGLLLLAMLAYGSILSNSASASR